MSACFFARLPQLEQAGGPALFLRREIGYNAAMNQVIQEKLKLLPDAPGVYRMYDAAGQVILRELKNSSHMQAVPCCVIDDNPNKWNRFIEGVPVIKENTCCWFLCKVQEKLDLPGQVVFVAEIIAGSDEAVGTPMTYKYYVEQLGGASPKYSPTYLPPARTFDKSSGESFVCSVCGYVYRDPNFGFEELPADWTCPVCRMPKKAFVRKK